MRTVAVIYKIKDPEARTLAGEVVRLLGSKGVRVVCEKGRALDGAVETERPAEQSDMVVVLGGDGTFLHAAGQMSSKVVPILGVNMGSLGFLTPFSAASALDAVAAALEGTLPTDTRMRLRVRQLRDGGTLLDTHAANDAVISQRSLARLLDIRCSFGGRRMTSYRADGLIVSTPMGSTGYGLAAGGPIIEPGLEAISMVPICPHQLTHRPLVLHIGAPLVVTVGEPAYLTVDGQRGMEVEPGDEVVIERSDLPLTVFLPEGYSFFDVLKHKLNWGMRGT